MCYIFVNGGVSWLKQLVTHHTQAEQVIIHDAGVTVAAAIYLLCNLILQLYAILLKYGVQYTAEIELDTHNKLIC